MSSAASCGSLTRAQPAELCLHRDRAALTTESLLAQGMIRKPVADASANTIGFFGPQQSTLDAALNRIQQFEPVLQGWLFKPLPAVIAPLPNMKSVLAPGVMHIYLEFDPLVGRAFPADLGLCHVDGRSELLGEVY